MLFSIGKEERLSGVFVVMRECEVPLGVIESDDSECERSDHVLLIRELLELGLGKET